MDRKLFIGVDVGSTSVRCAVVTSSGKIIKTSSSPIQTWNPSPDFYEQSSQDIWTATCKAVNVALEGQDPTDVKGVGFDATCSLVALGSDFSPVSISLTGDTQRNVVLWMDHRAIKEAEEINSTGHPVLKYVGNKIHCEMDPPKLIWLKKNIPHQWKKMDHFMELPDFMTWKATGCLSRSLCCVVCKWLYQANEEKHNWDSSFWKQIGLEELISGEFTKIGSKVQIPGSPCGMGLSTEAARDLGLLPHTPVSTSLIDAHAGGVGLLGCKNEKLSGDWFSRMAMICGTSTCNMVVSKHPVFTPGVWGPYYSAMVPGMWLNEAGQSSVGALVDHVIKSHPATKNLQRTYPNKHIQELLNDNIASLAAKKNLQSPSYLTLDLHIWPDFHGNRSPVADPSLKGMILGLSMSKDEDDLAKVYLATIQALAYGTRHIISSLENAGHRFTSIVMCGGMAKNKLYVQMHADVTGLPVIIPDEIETVLLGSAILAATASKTYDTVEDAMASMSGKSQFVEPSKNDKRYHDLKYEVFLSMLKLQTEARNVMTRFDTALFQ